MVSHKPALPDAGKQMLAERKRFETKIRHRPTVAEKIKRREQKEGKQKINLSEMME